jgi:hypothetical protein
MRKYSFAFSTLEDNAFQPKMVIGTLIATLMDKVIPNGNASDYVDYLTDFFKVDEETVISAVLNVMKQFFEVMEKLKYVVHQPNKRIVSGDRVLHSMSDVNEMGHRQPMKISEGKRIERFWRNDCELCNQLMSRPYMEPIRKMLTASDRTITNAKCYKTTNCRHNAWNSETMSDILLNHNDGNEATFKIGPKALSRNQDYNYSLEPTETIVNDTISLPKNEEALMPDGTIVYAFDTCIIEINQFSASTAMILNHMKNCTIINRTNQMLPLALVKSEGNKIIHEIEGNKLVVETHGTTIGKATMSDRMIKALSMHESTLQTKEESERNRSTASIATDAQSDSAEPTSMVDSNKGDSGVWQMVENERNSELIALLPLANEVDLPDNLVVAMSNLNNVRVPIYVNNAIPKSMGERYRKGRNLAHWMNTHLVDSMFIDGTTVDDTMLRWLTTFYGKILELNPKPDDVWNVYSLSPNMAERSPAITEGRHLHIGVRSEKFTTMGFETLELDSDPGRFGACLRVIFAMLLPYFKRIYIRSGRPGYHVLYTERQQMNIVNPTENTVVLPWNTFGPFLDGMIICQQISIEHKANFISANINYGELYGIDEANAEWFEITNCIYDPGNTAGYSTMSVNPNLIRLTNNVTMKPMDTSTDTTIWDIELARESAQNYQVMMPLAKMIDQAIVDGGRGITQSQALNKKLQRKMNEARDLLKQTKPTKGVKWDNEVLLSTYKDVSPRVTYSKTEDIFETDIEYSPNDNQHCVRDCFIYCVTRRSRSHNYDANIPFMLQLAQFKQLESLDKIAEIWTMFHMNVEIITPTTVKKIVTNDGPIDQLLITSETLGTEHCQVVKTNVMVGTPELKTETVLVDQNLYNNDFKVCFGDNVLTYDDVIDLENYLIGNTNNMPENISATLKRATTRTKMRVTGRPAHAARQTQGIVGLRANAVTAASIHATPKIKWTPELKPGKCYLIAYGMTMICAVCFEYKGKPAIRYRGPHMFAALDIRATIDELTKEEKQIVPVTTHVRRIGYQSNNRRVDERRKTNRASGTADIRFPE